MIASLAIAPQSWEATFTQLVERLRHELGSQMHFRLTLIGERSHFTRVNQAKVRQTGSVTDAELTLTLMHDHRISYRQIPLTGQVETDWRYLYSALVDVRAELPQLPADPYLILPSGTATTQAVYTGNLLSPEELLPVLLEPAQGTDLVGLYAGGKVMQGYADSAGQQHWFETTTFTWDYSLFAADGQAVKGTYAGSQWDTPSYQQKLQDSKTLLAQMAMPPKSIQRGAYRTYLAPSALAELIGMFSWGGISEAALQRGGSAFGPLRRGDKVLSPKFHLQENFSYGLVPRFNQMGEVAPMQLPLIQAGQLVNTLISSRTAKEYNLDSNCAEAGEYLRAPDISPGGLASDHILTALDTGLYVSNLHYLNWSDRPQGRITGMTRYACFWVEAGEIVAPIENLRFDESLYHCLGDGLIDLTETREFAPEVGTYDHRQLGGMWVPGALVEGFTYTL